MVPLLPFQELHAPRQVLLHMHGLHKTLIDHVGISLVRIPTQKANISVFGSFRRLENIIKKLQNRFIPFHPQSVSWSVFGTTFIVRHFSLNTKFWRFLYLLVTVLKPIVTFSRIVQNFYNLRFFVDDLELLTIIWTSMHWLMKFPCASSKKPSKTNYILYTLSPFI